MPNPCHTLSNQQRPPAAIAIRLSALALLVAALPACASGGSDSQATTSAPASEPVSASSSVAPSDSGMASSEATASQSGSEQPGAMDLTATKWELSGAGMESIDLAKFKITIEFTADKVSGFAGVNSYNGSYVAKRNGSIKFGPIATTKMAGDPDAMAAEAAYLKMLANANHYAADDAELTLIDPVGMTLKYSAAK